MDTFLENAQRIFEVARTDSSAEGSDFALLVRPDGSLHVVMETEMNLDSLAIHEGAATAYRVTRSRSGVRVSGRSGESRCELNIPRSQTPFWRRDQPLYLRQSLQPLIGGPAGSVPAPAPTGYIRFAPAAPEHTVESRG